MPEMTIIVEFETVDGREDEFLAVIRDHARRTLLEEPGCLRFEVIKPVAQDGTPIPNKVMVNELYADQAAVTAHDKGPRRGSLAATVAPMLKSRRLILARSLTEKADDDGLTPDELNASNDG